MAALDNIACAHTALHKRAAAILAMHGDAMKKAGFLDEVEFLESMVNQHMVWGTPRYEARLEKLEQQLNPGG